MKPVAYHPAAHAELEAEISYCESERPGAGVRVRADVAATLARVREFPGLGRRDHQGWQHIVTRRCHYVVHYELLRDEIVVWAVADPAREPGYWLSRRQL
ncbi:MAG: type II toxin-antitoxin system RelE/ParE family toxin [Verrucomicrobia bacterium]|nr:type II toxin-antitoxin system RelE/ParE family toxin [Verrucomicrobiota bacterium]